jgi:uncharacterized membrane protein (UPF0127 family)
VTLDDWGTRAERHEPWVRRTAWAVLAVGLLAFVVRGADNPADPYLVASGQRPLAGFSETAFQVTTPDGKVLDWCALLAATEAAREQGLMGQRDLRGYGGMVFRFEEPTDARFYMFHTLIPLSVAFFDERGAFVSASDMEPCRADEPGDCPTFAAAGPYVDAIEVAKGDLGRLGIGPGATVALTEGDCA